MVHPEAHPRGSAVGCGNVGFMARQERLVSVAFESIHPHDVKEGLYISAYFAYLFSCFGGSSLTFDTYIHGDMTDLCFP